MINRIKEYIKWKLAGDELKELHYLKMDIELLKVYTSHIKIVSVAARWLQDRKDYPCQFQAAHGSIDDFRVYLKKLSQGSEQDQNGHTAAIHEELKPYNPLKEDIKDKVIEETEDYILVRMQGSHILCLTEVQALRDAGLKYVNHQHGVMVLEKVKEKKDE